MAFPRLPRHDRVGAAVVDSEIDVVPITFDQPLEPTRQG
jgi:hypothetical protein